MLTGKVDVNELKGLMSNTRVRVATYNSYELFYIIYGQRKGFYIIYLGQAKYLGADIREAVKQFNHLATLPNRMAH